MKTINELTEDKVEALIKAGAKCGCCADTLDVAFWGGSVGSEVWCSDCFEDEYEHACIRCEHRVPKATVGQKGDLFILVDERNGLKAGLYQIVEIPYYGDDMLSVWLWKDAVKFINDNTFGVVEDGLLCRRCKVELLGVNDE